MEHWVAGWGREGFVSDEAAVFGDEEAGRDFLLEGLSRRRRHSSDGEQFDAAENEIEDGYGATDPVQGTTFFVQECTASDCAYPARRCVTVAEATTHPLFERLAELAADAFAS